ncbi:MAG: flagellar assembly peptidoglycan hydrolase FlgJ [Betaproteobacteria bacterium]|nr:flagellar assembly peptidoglycan hydrolase FlgJ [Betaproteobacteria bacterium]
MTVNQNRNIAGGLAFDTQSLDQLKLQAKRDPDKAVAAAAKQFESVFLGMVLKSMREATPQDGVFSTDQTKLYTSLLDQQLAQHLAARGTGLSQVMARQLSPRMASGAAPDAAEPMALPLSLASLAPATAGMASPRPSAGRLAPVLVPDGLSAADTPEASPDEAAESPAVGDEYGMPHVVAAPPASSPTVTAMPIPLGQTRDFVNRIWTHAVDAARSIGVKPQFMVGQAALESGWGRHEIRAADGRTSHNLFGVKAGRNWKGPVVEKPTTEYVNGVAQKTTARFRVYESYAEAFNDYASLLKNNARYDKVVGQSHDAKGFAKGLQQAGYATDPAYADKLVRVINGATLRVSLLGEPPAQVLARR